MNCETVQPNHIRGHGGRMVDTIDAAVHPFEDIKVKWQIPSCKTIQGRGKGDIVMMVDTINAAVQLCFQCHTRSYGGYY